MRFRPAAPLLALAVALPAAARAEGYHYLGLSLLYGADFHDPSVGNDTRGGGMGTLTLEGFSAWPYGDVYFFVDFLHGDFVGAGGIRDRIYAELIPRLSLSRLAGRRVGAGVLRDVLVAAEFNRGGQGFVANMAGIGFDLAVPGVQVLGLNLYYRDDNFDAPSYQATLVWHAPFDAGPVGLALDGFADLYGTDATAWNLMTQPQLLVDVGRPLGLGATWLWVGTEWYLHRTDAGLASVPQAMAKAIW
jgi:nucleoside-specific outer membrane channel protein Tsx